MDPMSFETQGPSKHMRRQKMGKIFTHVIWWTQWGLKSGSIKAHEVVKKFGWVHQITWVFWVLMRFCGPKNLIWFDGPWKSSTVHQDTWGLGPGKHMRFSSRNGSIKTHEGARGEKQLKTLINLGPSNHMRIGQGKILIWVHQITWVFRVQQITWRGKKCAKFGRVHQITWVPNY